MAQVAVMGAGSWGTAFALVLADAGNEVTMWGRRQELCAAISSEHEITDYLSGIALPVKLDHDRHLHRRRGVKAQRRVDGDLLAWRRVKRPPNDGDLSAGLGDECFDLRAGGGDTVLGVESNRNREPQAHMQDL